MARFLHKARRTAILRWARAVVPASPDEIPPAPISTGSAARAPAGAPRAAPSYKLTARPAEPVLFATPRPTPRNVRVRVAAPADAPDSTPAPFAVELSGSRTDSVRSRFVPAGRPRGRRIVAGGAVVALASVLSLSAILGLAGPPRALDVPTSDEGWSAMLDLSARRLLAPAAAADRIVDLAPLAETHQEPAPLQAPRVRLDREGYSHIPGGVMYVPSTFTTRSDGSYDLYVHFHGNTHVVLESAEYAGLDAIVAVVNLGVNSAPYLDAYDPPGSFERTLGAIGRALGERGLDGAHLARLAIGSWSGGYGAISRILDREPRGVDAVLVLDGIHCGYLDEEKRALNVMVISPFLVGAQRAARGELLFSITHSEIDPVNYAGSAQTAGYLLDAVHGHAGEPLAAPEHVDLKSVEGAVAKKLEKHMEPISEARVGSFHVRGYRGNTPEHHMAHLFQMAATVMPELVARWRR